jgi:hypothetical protein
MSEYRRPRHRTVASLLAALDADFLAANHCYFGGGTRIALELDEFRESQDVDFLCADLAGYRAVRANIDDRSLGLVLRNDMPGVTLLRDVRADQYGIRTVIGVQGEPVKFEIILEARITLEGRQVSGIPVASLNRVSCFAEKWLANADRWNDTAVMSRDIIDLAFMLAEWDETDALAGVMLAQKAYGAAIGRSAVSAATKIAGDPAYRKQCVQGLAIEDTKRLLRGLGKVKRLASGPP